MLFSMSGSATGTPPRDLGMRARYDSRSHSETEKPMGRTSKLSGNAHQDFRSPGLKRTFECVRQSNFPVGVRDQPQKKASYRAVLGTATATKFGISSELYKVNQRPKQAHCVY